MVSPEAARQQSAALINNKGSSSAESKTSQDLNLDRNLSGNAWHTFAKITDNQDKIYEGIYKPFELDTLRRYRDLDPGLFAQQAHETSTMTSDSNRGITNREFGRYGSALNTKEKNSLSAFYDRLSDVSGITGMNQVYDDVSNIRDDARGRMINIGRGVARSSVDLASTASGLQTQRESQYRVAKAQGSASRLGAAASFGVAGYALAAGTALGGPAGAAIGVALSWMLG